MTRMGNLVQGFLLLILARSSFGYEVIVTDPEPVPMWSTNTVSFRVKMDLAEQTSWTEDVSVKLKFNLTNEASWALEVLNESLSFSYEDMLWSKKHQLHLEAHVIGVDSLNVTSEVVRSGFGIVSKNETAMAVPVTAILADRTLNNLFTGIMMTMIIINTVNMGGQLDLHIIKEVFKRPVGPVVGFISQFVLMPLFSYGIGALMFDDKLFRLGLFVLGCSPGGNGSNFWALLLNGDINLSITMTFISTIAALAMMPLWIFLLGRFLSEGNLVIPYTQLFSTLLMLIGPIALGMWIRYRWTRGAKIMKKIIVPFTLLTVLFIFTAGIYINLFIFMLMTGKMVAAGFLIAFCGYLFGAVFAWICRLKPAQITAVSIETAFQNGGIAFVLLKLSLPPPYGDMAAVAPVAQLMLTGLPLWLVLAVWKIYQRFFLKKDDNDQDEAEITDEKELESEKKSKPFENGDQPMTKDKIEDSEESKKLLAKLTSAPEATV